MNKDTRNRIQRATQDARALLEHEYAEQLEGTFDIRLEGTIEPSPGEHLDAHQRVIRTKLVTAVEHQRAGNQNNADAVAAYLREAAFTTLNRFVALKMLEARGLVQECISRGTESSGFKNEFTGLALGLRQLDHSYRVFIESLFDEVGREVRVLFDRRDPASLLWPRRQALLELFNILNGPDLSAVWGEDETIGWVYQYFNSDDERKQMRAESQAPRDSQELAVRNQFFTPRYVVQFLTDNTLGRIWHEMRQGETGLVDECAYLVRRPREVFLSEGESSADAGTNIDGEDHTQGRLVDEPVQVPFRRRKDPRDLTILDPACGSGHFLLYAFGVLATIYEEGWADEAAVVSSITGRRLRDDYRTYEELQLAIPGLILRYNLHGIDIDLRAAQIAAFSLWARAQRAHNERGIAPSDRPAIDRTNIVVAEPMPGDPQLREEFLKSLDPSLRNVVAKVFASVELAGEAGSLLQIDSEIDSAIRAVYAETGGLFRGTDVERWEQVEQALAESLNQYANRAHEGQSYQRRLFADDAARGLGFIDLCRRRYDVVLMNPPFGRVAEGAKSLYDRLYSDYKSDIGIGFLAHFLTRRLLEGGQLGAIVSRNFIAADTFKRFRESVLLGDAPINLLADLGYGVLDSAMVEAALVVASPRTDGTATFYRALEVRNKEEAFHRCFVEGGRDSGVRQYIHSYRNFRKVPLNVLCYWLPEQVLQKITSLPTLSASHAAARHGMRTTDDFRFLRLWWEVADEEIGDRWRYMAKGGEYQPLWEDLAITVDWKANGHALKTYLADKRLRLQGSADWTPWLNHSEFYFLPGLTYPERTTSDFSPRVFPKDAAFGGTGVAIQFESLSESLAYLVGSYSRMFKLVTESFVGSGDNAFSGSAANSYRSGLLNQLPAPLDSLSHDDEAVALRSISFFRNLAACQETSPSFSGLLPPGGDIETTAIQYTRRRLRGYAEVLAGSLCFERLVNNYYGLDASDERVLDDLVGPHPALYPPSDCPSAEELATLWNSGVESLASKIMERDGPRRQVTKKSYFANRSLELVSHLLRVDARVIAERICADDEATRSLHDIFPLAKQEISYAIGVAFGRWSADATIDLGRPTTIADVQSQLPSSAARNAGTTPGILVDDEGHADDVVQHIRGFLEHRWGRSTGALETMARFTGGLDLRSFIRGKFWPEHLREYSQSRRKAPIYWQLATPSSNYSVWVYYHSLTSDSLYRVLHDYVTPKLTHEERKLTTMIQDTGQAPSSRQRKDLDAQKASVAELRAFAAEVSRVAPLWNPNLNDGVIINFAPLWRFVPQHRAWQKECKKVWDELCKGDYEWAQLAMHLWPERVVPKCAKDRSLAIAHGLEDAFWNEESDGKWTPRKVDQAAVDRLIEQRASVAVKDALEKLLEAPIPVKIGKTSRRKSSRSSKERRSRVGSQVGEET